jgi:hypothetical protein
VAGAVHLYGKFGLKADVNWAGNMPTARYQHGAVFVGARLHISGGAVGGGRMVDDQSAIVVLDTAAGTWCTQVEPSAMNGTSAGDGAESWARRCGASKLQIPCHKYSSLSAFTALAPCNIHWDPTAHIDHCLLPLQLILPGIAGCSTFGP